MRKPDFFIVGAPKCGTSSLQAYLAQHPEIHIPLGPPREPHFFLPEIRPNPMSEKEYLGLFDAGTGCRRAGEKSVWYLYAPAVAQRIFDFNPASGIIVMLRQPADMLYSLHAQLRYSMQEDIADFHEAVEAEPDRREGRRIPPGCRWPALLWYRDVMCFSDQLERYFERFGREKVCVLIFDDFVRDPPGSYEQVLRFLGVEPSFRPEFVNHNPNKLVRSRRLMYWRHNYPQWMRSLGRAVMPSQSLRNGLMSMLTGINTRRAPRPPLDPELRAKLRREFRPEVEKLARLLGRDLTPWMET